MYPNGSLEQIFSRQPYHLWLPHKSQPVATPNYDDYDEDNYREIIYGLGGLLTRPAGVAQRGWGDI